jgi:hypothetical protein
MENDLEMMRAGMQPPVIKTFMTNKTTPDVKAEKEKYKLCSGQDEKTKKMLHEHRIDG